MIQPLAPRDNANALKPGSREVPTNVFLITWIMIMINGIIINLAKHAEDNVIRKHVLLVM